MKQDAEENTDGTDFGDQNQVVIVPHEYGVRLLLDDDDEVAGGAVRDLVPLPAHRHAGSIPDRRWHLQHGDVQQGRSVGTSPFKFK